MLETTPILLFQFSWINLVCNIKMTQIKLKLISDIGKYYFVGNGLRGGISYISKKFSELNNIYMQNCDPTKENKYITDLDANNLFGWAMSQYLPYGEFKWVKNDNVDVSPYDYILVVDLEYPDDLHNLDNNYPLAQEKLEITFDM